VRLDVHGVDHLRLARPAAIRKLAEQPLPHAASRPSHKAVVNRRWRTVFRRAIAPPAAALQHMQNAADHPAIIDAIFPAHVRGQKRLDPLPLLVVQPEQVASHDLCSDFSRAGNHYPIYPSSPLLSLNPSQPVPNSGSTSKSRCRGSCWGRLLGWSIGFPVSAERNNAILSGEYTGKRPRDRTPPAYGAIQLIIALSWSTASSA
jgi:hypothetical protein